MLLSILTPTLNCARTLPSTLRSVKKLQESLSGRIEHLIGDAGSTDGSAEIISQYIEDNSWAQSYLLAGFNIPTTLNHLLQLAGGRWVVVLNGDDFYEVKNMAALLSGELPKVPSVLCGQVSVLSFNDESLGFRDCRPNQLGRFMSINHPAMLVDRRLFSVIGGFNQATPVAYDYVWAWRAFRADVPFVKYDVILACARLGGISQTKSHQSAKEILKAKMAAGIVFSALMDYILFFGKLGLRKILPLSLTIKIIRQYRKIKGSIERY
jgi:glycosyltransferase involved in cell wall biosynthesis